MNKTYMKLVAVLAVVLILAPILPATSVVKAQYIADYSTEIKPGGVAWVQVNVPSAGTLVKVELIADNGTVWNSVTRVFASGGVYTISLAVPKILPGIGTWFGLAQCTLRVTVGIDTEEVYPEIIPVVEVTPSYTTNIDVNGNSQSITVKAYGVPERTTVRYVDVINTTLGIEKSWDLWTLLGSLPSADDTGYVEISNLNLSDLVDYWSLTPDPWLPRGSFAVDIDTNNSDVNADQETGTLRVGPAIYMSGDGEGNGRDSDLASIEIYGYGFDANAEIHYIKFINQNFTGVEYTFTADGANNTVSTDESGTFVFDGLSPATNMTAGLYYIEVGWRAPGIPSTLVWSDSDTAAFTVVATGTGGDILYAANSVSDGTVTFESEVYVNATQSRDLVAEYQSTSGTTVYLDFTYGGHEYRLVGEKYYSTVTFTLYNLSSTPAVTLFSDSITGSLVNVGGTNYYYAWVAFNISPSVAYTLGTTHPPTGNYVFYAEYFGNYTYSISYMNLSELMCTINYANITITYENADTGNSTTWFWSTDAGNLTITDNRFSVETGFYIDVGYNVTAELSGTLNTADANYYTTTLTGYLYTLTVPPSEGESQLFTAPAYIVRPILVPMPTELPIKPGDEVPVAAYGFGPGFWSDTENWLTVMWDEMEPVTITWAETAFSGNQVKLGKDGNVTFIFVVPEGESFGAHYLRGRDTWNYEYSALVIIGAQAIWAKVETTPLTETGEWIVSASHPVYGQVFASVCGEYKASKYCGLCVKTNTEIADYLGDVISINVSGLTPGMTITVYFGDILVGSYIANDTSMMVEFVVPPVPAGKYPIKIVTPYEEIPVMYFFNGTGLVEAAPEVVPKLLLVSLENPSNMPILVGPGIVRVIGTGFPTSIAFRGLIVNNTDAISGLNPQISNWYVTDDGTIETFSGVDPSLFIPMLEPGAYEVKLVYSEGDEMKETQPGYVYVINNISDLLDKTTFDSFADAVTASLEDISGTLSVIDSKVGGLTTQVSTIASQVSGLAVSLSELSGKVDGLTTTVSDIASNVDTLVSDSGLIKADLSDLKSMVGSINVNVDLTPVLSKLDSIDGKLGTLQSGQSSISSKLDSLSGDVTDAVSAANAAKASADAAKAAAQSAVDTLGNVKTELASKIDSSTNILYVTTIFALLAFVFAILSWITARKATAK